MSEHQATITWVWRFENGASNKGFVVDSYVSPQGHAEEVLAAL